MRLAWLFACLFAVGCGDETVTLDGAVTLPDGGSDDFGVDTDGGGSLRGGFTVVGCARLDESTSSPQCTGAAPLRLTFVPLTSGVTMFLWTFPGGDPPSSRAITPSVSFARPGTYAVTLAAGGTAGTTSATGTVVVTAGGAGAPCSDDLDCDPVAGLSCLCKDGACPGGFSVGVCTRACDDAVCGGNELCVDLSRGVSAPMSLADGGVVDGGADAPWRRALCLPSCTTDQDCRPGLYCRDVPALEPLQPAGGAYAWQRACVIDTLGDDGDACRAPSGELDPASCLSGRCDPLGARGLCTSDCAVTACPGADACVVFNATPSVHECLRRCDPTQPCTDPLFACEPPKQAGALGFTVPASEPAGATYCAPKKCSAASDCGPAGACVPMGGASYCVRAD